MEDGVVEDNELKGQVSGGIEVDDFVVQLAVFEFHHLNSIETLALDESCIFVLDLSDDDLDIFVSLNCGQADVLIAICDIHIQTLIFQRFTFWCGTDKFVIFDIDVKGKDDDSGFFSACVIVDDGSVDDVGLSSFRSHEEVNNVSLLSFSSVRNILADFDDRGVVKNNVGGSQVYDDFIDSWVGGVNRGQSIVVGFRVSDDLKCLKFISFIRIHELFLGIAEVFFKIFS